MGLTVICALIWMCVVYSNAEKWNPVISLPVTAVAYFVMIGVYMDRTSSILRQIGGAYFLYLALGTLFIIGSILCVVRHIRCHNRNAQSADTISAHTKDNR